MWKDPPQLGTRATIAACILGCQLGRDLVYLSAIPDALETLSFAFRAGVILALVFWPTVGRPLALGKLISKVISTIRYSFGLSAWHPSIETVVVSVALAILLIPWRAPRPGSSAVALASLAWAFTTMLHMARLSPGGYGPAVLTLFVVALCATLAQSRWTALLLGLESILLTSALLGTAPHRADPPGFLACVALLVSAAVVQLRQRDREVLT